MQVGANHLTKWSSHSVRHSELELKKVAQGTVVKIEAKPKLGQKHLGEDESEMLYQLQVFSLFFE